MNHLCAWEETHFSFKLSTKEVNCSFDIIVLQLLVTEFPTFQCQLGLWCKQHSIQIIPLKWEVFVMKTFNQNEWLEQRMKSTKEATSSCLTLWTRVKTNKSYKPTQTSSSSTQYRLEWEKSYFTYKHYIFYIKINQLISFAQ